MSRTQAPGGERIGAGGDEGERQYRADAAWSPHSLAPDVPRRGSADHDAARFSKSVATWTVLIRYRVKCCNAIVYRRCSVQIERCISGGSCANVKQRFQA